MIQAQNRSLKQAYDTKRNRNTLSKSGNLW